MKKAGKLIGAILLLAAIAVAFLGYYIATNCTGREPVNLTQLPDPMETVETFFDGVCAQDYAPAYACLDGYETLGLENVPEDPHAAALWAIVRNGSSWKALSPSTVNGTEASVRVELVSPDLNLLTEGLDGDVNARISQKVEEAVSIEGIYDEEENYLPEFVLEVYDEVLRERLEQSSYPTRSDEIEVRLTYRDRRWLILPDSTLMDALCGGVQ